MHMNQLKKVVFNILWKEGMYIQLLIILSSVCEKESRLWDWKNFINLLPKIVGNT